MKKNIGKEEQLRLEKLDQLRALGIEPYPAERFLANTTVADIQRIYKESPDQAQEVILAGRLMGRRIMGGVSFGELQDHTGKVQLYFARDILCPNEDKSVYNTFFKKLLDLGDLIGIEGETFTTQVGALAIRVASIKLLSKALKPLPSPKEVVENGVKKTYYSFSNPEQRYRQRYLDLILNPEVKEIFEKRAAIIRSLRKQLDDAGYLEVETPILQPIYGGASARPFMTHHNALNMPLYLRIANELYLKRLILGGYPGVYEFAKDFRNEGMSRYHNPEFTQLEFYVAYRDHVWMMEAIEKIIQKLIADVHGTLAIPIGDRTIDFGKPWKRFTLLEALAYFTGTDVEKMNDEELKELAQKHHVSLPENPNHGQLLDALFGDLCESNFIEPTFITDYPTSMSPLAKQYPDRPEVVQRFEVICNGKELCNAFSELNDPLEQWKRFKAQQRLAQGGDDEAMQLDEDFLQAMSYGMPPMAGLGIGIDRLTMLLTNQPSIQEVILFPQMRKEKLEKNDRLV